MALFAPASAEPTVDGEEHAITGRYFLLALMLEPFEPFHCVSRVYKGQLSHGCTVGVFKKHFL